MAKTYEEQLKDLQNKMSLIKKKKKEADRKKTYAFGEAMSRLFPELFDKFGEDNFDIDNYLYEEYRGRISDDLFNKTAQQSEVEEVESRPAYGNYYQNN